MIKVQIHRNRSGFPYGFTCKGHAGYNNDGPDIICAAVTSLATTVISALTDLLHLDVDYILAEGDISCTVPLNHQISERTAAGVELLMNTFQLGCEQIALSYGDKYVKVVKAR